VTVLIATGVEREAAVLRRLPGATVIAGGGDAAGLRRRLDTAAASATAIASIGLAGALDPALGLGDWIVADRIVGAIDHPCDSRWSDALARSLPHARRGAIFADGRLIADPAEKQALARFAGAVDMESHVAAAVAAAHGLPFMAARCISDTASHALPPAIAVAMRADGGLDLTAVLGSIISRPGQLPALFRTVAGFGKAFAEFRRTVPRLAPALSDRERT
jgi:nucleoside phosphorylase